MNWRVAAFFYRWHRDVAGMPEAQARALMARQWTPEGSDRPRRGLGGVHRRCADRRDGFAGRHVVITGASTGIGRATARGWWPAAAR
jgi:hypothetical protein